MSISMTITNDEISFKTQNKIEQYANLYKNSEIIVEVKNTKKIDKQSLLMLPPNVKIRVASGYDETKVNHYGKDNYRYTSVVYDRFELYKIIERMEEIESKINLEWSEIQKAVYVYDRLKRKVIYTLGEDTNENDRTLRGLILGENVCAGHAMIYKEMMDRQNIICDYAEGDALSESTGKYLGAHAWNILRIDGENIPVDITWDAGGYRAASQNDNFFGNVDSFNKTHRPWKIEPIQHYSKNLKGLTREFVRKIQYTVNRTQSCENRVARAHRADGSKFIIALSRQNENGLNEYVYADINEKGYPENMVTLFSKSNIADLVEKTKRCKDEKNAKSLKNDSLYVINTFLSKENIRRACNNNGYIGEMKKEGGRFKIKYSLTSEEIDKLPKMIRTVKRADGTSAIISKERKGKVNGQEVFSYIVYDIDSHIYRSKEKKDYYVVNTNRIFSESDLEKFGHDSETNGCFASLFTQSRIARIAKDRDGYMGYIDLQKRLCTRKEDIQEFFKSKYVTFTQSDLVKPSPIIYGQPNQQKRAPINNQRGSIMNDLKKVCISTLGTDVQKVAEYMSRPLTPKVSDKDK